ncbi:hypothetical protein DSO57_1011320 [Entomophthora muscae]|uniref:Uncharacterized protein n=1 Tax=Entomophthora muscae TaxID=34485 RepID=A0ACC2T672_9FUNG|nr:hypothetical protein DSO57_1011320 [Entomophthora muscae]
MGKPAEASKVPYLVRIFIDDGMCGGGLISKTAILTAAHCTTVKNLSRYDIREGKNTQEEMDSANELIAVKVHSHENFTTQPKRADIAIIRIRPNHNLKVFLKVDTTGRAKIGTKLHLEGWGVTDVNGEVSSLNKLDQRVVSNDKCKDGPAAFDSTSFFCAAAKKQGSTACSGDSGSPLVLGTTIVGLVSHGDTMCRKSATAFTKVSSYARWISQNMK